MPRPPKAQTAAKGFTANLSFEADFGGVFCTGIGSDISTDDVRWQFGVPPKGNANFAWIQHFIHHLAA